MSYVSLHCSTCSLIDCPIARLYVPGGSLEGCTRALSDEDADLYRHYDLEVVPLASLSRSLEDCVRKMDEVEGFYQEIVYKAPIGRRIDEKGKALPND